MYAIPNKKEIQIVMHTSRRKVIGVMGGASADDKVLKLAEELGKCIAEKGYILLTGGRPAGVMHAASRGAKQAGGLVVGILPGPDSNDASPYVDIAIATNLSDARNLINILSSDVVIACPGGAGTLCEVALAIKNTRPLVLLGFDPGPIASIVESAGLLARASNPVDALKKAQELMQKIQ